jgi:YVTN family beta-propeller protein
MARPGHATSAEDIIMKTLLLAATAAASLAFAGPALAATVYVADEEGATITTIDTVTGATTQTAIGISPHNVDVTPDGARVLASGVAAHGHDVPGMEGGGQLVVMDAAPEGLRPAAMVPVGGHPAHVVPSPDGRTAYVTDAETDSVLVVDLAEGRVRRTIEVGRYPHGLRLSPDGSTLAVADMKDDTVSLIAIADGTVSSVPVPGKPVQVAFSPDGKTLWVSQNGADSVAAIDVSAGKVDGSYPIGDGPVQVSVTPDGAKVLVANQGSKKKPGRTVSVLEAASGALLTTITVGKGAHGVTVTPDGRAAYVTNSFEDTVSEVDLATLKEVRRFYVGKAPNGIASH